MDAMTLGILIVIAAFAIAIGVAIGIKLSPGAEHSAELEQELSELKEEFSSYRENVANDYMKTAQLLNNMTDSYRAVHEHLAASAQELCSDQMKMEYPLEKLTGSQSTGEKERDIVDKTAMHDLEAQANEVNERNEYSPRDESESSDEDSGRRVH